MINSQINWIMVGERMRALANAGASSLGLIKGEGLDTRQAGIVGIAVITVVFVVIAQFIGAYFVRVKHKWLLIVSYLVLDLLLLVALLGGLIVWDQVVVDARKPKNVVIERVNQGTVVVSWKSKDPEMSLVIWGYDPHHLQHSSLGSNLETKEKDHEVVFAVENDKEISMMIFADGALYGENGSSTEPYLVSGVNNE